MNLKYLSAEWHAERRNFVGASEAASLLKANPFKTLAELAYEKKEGSPLREPSQTQKSRMFLGLDLEPKIIYDINSNLAHFGLSSEIKASQNSFFDKKHKLMATIDAESIDGSTAVEIKTTSQSWNGVLPKNYDIQVQTQNICKPFKKHVLVVLSFKNQKYDFFNIKINKALQERIKKASLLFWNRLENDYESFFTNTNKLSRPAIGLEKSLIKKYSNLKAREAKLKKELEMVRNKILERMAELDEFTDENENKLISKNVFFGTLFDKKIVEAKAPALYNEATKKAKTATTVLVLPRKKGDFK